jgi:hypothetical protein
VATGLDLVWILMSSRDYDFDDRIIYSKESKQAVNCFPSLVL